MAIALHFDATAGLAQPTVRCAMGDPAKSVTILTIPVPELRRHITVVIEPALEPEQQKTVDEAARKADKLSEVVCSLMIHAAHHGCSIRSIAVEDSG